MTRNKRISSINLAIYLLFFVTDMLLIGMVKDEMLGVFKDLFSGGEIILGGIASAAVMSLAMILLIISGVTCVVNVVLKINI